MQLCVTVYIGITITKFWKLFFYGVKRDNYENFIGIRDLLERLALDFFNDPFSNS